MGEPTQGPFSACAKDHVAYRPKAGDALMFYDLSPDYKTPDGMSTHTGCPVVTGVKWNAVKWIHGIPFRGKLQSSTVQSTCLINLFETYKSENLLL
jgi:prolyl 4-hydroxylase